MHFLKMLPALSHTILFLVTDAERFEDTLGLCDQLNHFFFQAKLHRHLFHDTTASQKDDSSLEALYLVTEVLSQ